MGKKKEKVVNLKPEKISDEHLAKLQGTVQALNNLKLEIAQLEIQKYNTLHTVSQGNEQLNKLQEELREEYGDNVDVNINDGAIRYKEDEPSDS
jgi:TolA-binding protein